MNSRVLPRVALAAILLVAAFLRFWNLDATEFKYDEARVSNLAAAFVDTGVPPVRGMGSSIGIDNPPMTVYLMGLPVLLSRDPLFVTAFVALLNVTAVWGCYGLGRRYWCTGVGLVAAALLAVSPWAVFYSRKVWAQDLLLPGILLFFGLLLAWLVDGRRWALSGSIVTLAALTQIHFSTLALIPLLLLILSIALVRTLSRSTVRKRPGGPGTSFPWKPLAVGVAASALLYAPYFIFDALIDWRNVRTFLQVLRTPSQTDWESVRYALLNIGGREIHALAGSAQFRHFLASILDLRYWPDRIEEGAAVAGVLYLAYRWWRQRRDPRTFRRDGLLLLWLLAPPLFYLRSQADVFPHYLIPLYPAPYLALAIAAIDALRWARRRLGRPGWAEILGAALLAGLAVWQGYLSLSIHAFVEQHDTPGGMGTPIGIYRDVVQTMERYADDWGNPRVVMVCPGDDPRWEECPAVFHFLTSRSFDLRLVDQNASLLFPHSQQDTLIVLAPGESKAAAELPRHAQLLADASVPLREGVGAYTFYRLPAGYEPHPAAQPADAPVRLANGVSLLGYEIDGPLAAGATARLALHWRVDAVPDDPPPQGYSFANHVIAADDHRYGQQDGPGHRVGLWREGDTLISWFDISLKDEPPPQPYRLRVGMYVYEPPDQFTTVPVVNDDGHPIAAAAEWRLVSP